MCVVVSRYNAPITDKLLDGAKRVYAARGGDPADLKVASVPGSFELPMLALAAAETEEFAGVVALGCLIKGETSHDRYIAEAVAHGLMQASMSAAIPIAFGVLTVDTPEQAEARAGGAHGNKGEEAMHAVLDTLASIQELVGGSVDFAEAAKEVVLQATRRLELGGRRNESKSRRGRGEKG